MRVRKLNSVELVPNKNVSANCEFTYFVVHSVRFYVRVTMENGTSRHIARKRDSAVGAIFTLILNGAPNQCEPLETGNRSFIALITTRRDVLSVTIKPIIHIHTLIHINHNSVSSLEFYDYTTTVYSVIFLYNVIITIL